MTVADGQLFIHGPQMIGKVLGKNQGTQEFLLVPRRGVKGHGNQTKKKVPIRKGARRGRGKTRKGEKKKATKNGKTGQLQKGGKRRPSGWHKRAKNQKKTNGQRKPSASPRHDD